MEIISTDISDEEAQLKPNIAYIHLTHVEPFKSSKKDLLNKETNEEDDQMGYQLHTNIKTFVYEEKIVDEKAPPNAHEQAKLAIKRIILTGFN